MTSHLCGWLLSKKQQQQKTSIVEDVEKFEVLYTVGVDTKWCSWYRKQEVPQKIKNKIIL